MKNLEKSLRYSLYLLLPLVFFTVMHLTFAYSNWDINPANWKETTRQLSAIFGLMVAVIGALVASLLQD